MDMRGLKKWEPSAEDIERYRLRPLHGAVIPLELGPEDWPLLTDLRRYADTNGFSLAEAIRELLILGFLGMWTYPPQEGEGQITVSNTTQLDAVMRAVTKKAP